MMTVQRQKEFAEVNGGSCTDPGPQTLPCISGDRYCFYFWQVHPALYPAPYHAPCTVQDEDTGAGFTERNAMIYRQQEGQGESEDESGEEDGMSDAGMQED